MADLRLLLRLERMNLFRINEIRFTQDKKQKRRLVLMLFLYVVLALMGLAYASLLMWGLYEGGLARLLPALSVLLGAMLSLTVSVIRAQGLFFSPQGYERLAALPLKNSSIIFSRLIGVYVSALSVSAAAFLPACVFYLLSFGFSLEKALLWLLMLLLTPLPAMSAGLLLAVVPALLLHRLKNRSLLSALITVPLISYLMLRLYSLPMQKMDGAALLGMIGGGIESSLSGFYPPARLAPGLIAGDAGSLLSFAAFSLLPLALVSLALIKFYAPLQALLGKVHLRRAKARALRAKSPLLALTLKEARRMAASPLYLINTGVGLWMTPMALLFLPAVNPGLLGTALSLPAVREAVSRYLPLAACAFSAIALPATVSISMEGKSAWLMCTAPVSTGVLLGAKALFSLLFCLPPILLTAALLALHLRLSAALFLLCLLLPLSLCAACTAIGLSLDRRFVRYDWENEQQIIKNSAQTGLGLLAALILLALMYACFRFIPEGLILPAGFGLCALLALLALALLRRLFKTPVYQIP